MSADGCTERRSRNSTSPVEQLQPFRSDRCSGGRSKRCHHCSKLTTASSCLTSASSPRDTRPSSPSIHFRSLRLTLCHTSEMCRLTIIIIITSHPDKNSSGDEIVNVNFLRQHRTCRGQRLRPFNEFVISTKRLRQKRYTLPTCCCCCRSSNAQYAQGIFLVVTEP